METPIFSMENWWRWLIIITIIVGAIFLLKSLAKQLFGKSTLNDAKFDEKESYHNASIPSGDKRNDVASIDSGTNSAIAASVAIDAVML